MICCPGIVFEAFQKEDIAESLVFFAEQRNQDGVSTGDGEDMVEEPRAAEEVDPGPADDESSLEVVGGGGCDEKPGRLNGLFRRWRAEAAREGGRRQRRQNIDAGDRQEEVSGEEKQTERDDSEKISPGLGPSIVKGHGQGAGKALVDYVSIAFLVRWEPVVWPGGATTK